VAGDKSMLFIDCWNMEELELTPNDCVNLRARDLALLKRSSFFIQSVLDVQFWDMDRVREI
jgi:hypothetical protein